MSDWAIALIIMEGILFLALVYYLDHKKRMYMLEKGITQPDRSMLRAERRMLNGLFLTMAGSCMILAPEIANRLGIEAQLTFELLVASTIVLCAGISLIIGSRILREKDENELRKGSFELR
jgi:hypothetical protein